MEKKYLLPALKDDIGVDAKECWKEMDKAYDFLIDNLELYYEPNQSVFEGGSNAMPHMFEQMIVFQNAFLNEKHPEHSRAVAEWRAVLALMALQRIRNVKMDVIRVDLSEANDNPFLKAAYAFRPEDIPVFHNATWDFLYIIKVKDVPVAIFSPITLVCPAKQFRLKIKDSLKNDREWISIEKIEGNDQLKFQFSESGLEKFALVKWLKDLKGKIKYSGIANGDCLKNFDTVKRELACFIKEFDHGEYNEEEVPVLSGIYYSMNNSIRKEYDFMNICCDIAVKNPKLRFLIRRYKEDIFADKILVMVYNDDPDAIDRQENIPKLDMLYRNVLEIEKGKPIIEVYDIGGERKAACILLPFKMHFIEELMQNQITPDEFFGRFSAFLNPVKRQIDIVLQIEGFPYSFEKSYGEDEWQYIYGKDLEAVYVWPTAQMDVSGWKDYYVYSVEKSNIGIEISVPEETRRVKYINRAHGYNNNEFQLSRAGSFPSYVRYTYRGVNGFLPVRTKHEGADAVGAVANIIFDVGHATTNIAMIKTTVGDVDKDGKKLIFRIPRSSRIAGNEDPFKTVNINFVMSDEKDMGYSGGCIKNMFHSYQNYEKSPVVENDRRPFEDGQVLFDRSAYLNELEQAIVSYINFEYKEMEQTNRENSHIFIEQLLVYAIYQAMIQGCTYAKVYFTHSYGMQTEFGELKGLWENAFSNVRERTGIKFVGKEYVIGIREEEALSWYIYSKVYRERGMNSNLSSGDCLDIGINIGWKNTNIVMLSMQDEKTENDSKEKLESGQGSGNTPSGEENPEEQVERVEGKHTINVCWSRVEYAGRNISMLADAEKGELDFPAYVKLLSILLNGRQNADGNPVEERMLKEFEELFSMDVRSKDLTHYQGLFDTIAMRIDEKKFKVSPDVFNNMFEYKYFLMAVTYNIMLLFLEIGLLIKKRKYENRKRINIYLGGNGAKFLKWVANDKALSEINGENEHVMFIPPIKSGFIGFIEKVMDPGGDRKDIRIFLDEKADEQLVEGCGSMLFRNSLGFPEFTYEFADNHLQEPEYASFIAVINEARKEIFEGFPHTWETGDEGTHSGENICITDIIENSRKKVCKRVTDEINSIDGESQKGGTSEL